MYLSRMTLPCSMMVLLLLAMPVVVMGAETIEGRSGIAPVQRSPEPAPGKAAFRGIYSSPPARRPGAEAGVKNSHRSVPVPVGPDTGRNLMDLGPPVEIDSPGTDADTSEAATRAAGDLSQFRNTNVAAASTSVINEPSIGSNGRVLFYTGNWFAAFSGDGGQTWSFVDPYDNFPADGNLDVPANSGAFCCDQVVYYEPTRGLMIWFLQYLRSGTDTTADTNIQRIAVARSQQDVLNNNWIWWDFTPGDLGYAATGKWFDYPDVSVSANNLYFTTNVFDLGGGATSQSVMVRMSLDDIKDGGNLAYSYWNINTASLRGTHGAKDVMYFGSHWNTTTLKLYRLAENSTTLTSVDISHNSYNAGNMTALCRDGNNFAGRSDSRVLAGWYTDKPAGGAEVGFAWNAAQGANRPYPYTRFMRIRVSDNSVRQQRDIYSNNFAWLYPSVHVNDRGHIAGTINYGCGTSVDWPRAAVWIVDDYNSPAFPDLLDFQNQAFASSNDGPSSESWGDYNTTRKMVPYGNTWVGTGHRLTGGGGGGSVVPEFVWFGRERDMPPASNRIYVDYRNTSGWETGSAAHPYNTVREGDTALQPNDTLIIRNGVYNEAVLFDTPSTIQPENGPAIIQ